jgi:nitrous oxide reductase
MTKNLITPKNEDRRDFLKKTSALVGASSAAGLGAFAVPAFADGHGLAAGMTGGPTGLKVPKDFNTIQVCLKDDVLRV